MYYLQDARLDEQAAVPLQIPVVGTCTDISGIAVVLKEPLLPLDCSLPAASKRIVASTIVSGTDAEVDCSGTAEMLIISQGRNYGEHVIAHSCAVPNLQVGQCYNDGITGYTHDPTCRASEGSGRLERSVPGVLDKAVCEPPADTEAGLRMKFISVSHLHYLNAQENATYCFVPPSGWRACLFLDQDGASVKQVETLPLCVLL
ncbi:hypothetical protein [Nocardia sp. NPDC048505]|uniref:hypothetical protein n=1 Tax=unclassified Nocardia TaxID=2637762 RepID=UPI0034103356